MPTVRCRPIKIVYENFNGFRVVSCELIEGTVPLNNFNCFNIIGNNLGSIKLREVYEFKIELSGTEKYPDSYQLVGHEGITLTDTIIVDPEKEVDLLSHPLGRETAKKINEVCSNFLQLALRSEIELVPPEVEEILGGAKNLEICFHILKEEYNEIVFMDSIKKWNLPDKSSKQAVTMWDNPLEFEKEMAKDPYEVLTTKLHLNFNEADFCITSNHPVYFSSLERCQACCIHFLKENEQEGDTKIFVGLLKELVENRVGKCIRHFKKAVTGNQHIFYDEKTQYVGLRSTYVQEVFIADELSRRLKNPKSNGWLRDSLITEIDGISLTEEQISFLNLVSEKSVVMLCGAAGQGKSFTINALVQMFKKVFSDHVLLAPTGAAAKVLGQYTGTHTSTIHKYAQREKSEVNYCIVDEASMVGTDLMYKLLSMSSIKKSRLVLVCDESQLASVGYGNVVQDLIDSGLIPTVRLTKTFRYNTSGIITVATDTRNGKPLNTSQEFDDYSFIPINESPLEQVVEAYRGLLDKGFNKEDILILCPFNKKMGTVRINKQIQSLFNSNKTLPFKFTYCGEKVMFKLHDKVINTHNNYSMTLMEYDERGVLKNAKKAVDIMNGDIGYIHGYSTNDEGQPVLYVEYDIGIVETEMAQIKNLLLGYAISCHKAQGSQAKAVIVLIDESHKNMITRNLLYVAFSRAQEKLIIIGDETTINAGMDIEENKERETWLKELLLPRCDYGKVEYVEDEKTKSYMGLEPLQGGFTIYVDENEEHYTIKMDSDDEFEDEEITDLFEEFKVPFENSLFGWLLDLVKEEDGYNDEEGEII